MRQEYEDREDDNRKKKKRPRPVNHCEFCWYDDQDELEKCYTCNQHVCKNPTCRLPHDKGTCGNGQDNQGNTNRGKKPHHKSR